jgi:hypothetical protein
MNAYDVEVGDNIADACYYGFLDGGLSRVVTVDNTRTLVGYSMVYFMDCPANSPGRRRKYGFEVTRVVGSPRSSCRLRAKASVFLYLFEHEEEQVRSLQQQISTCGLILWPGSSWVVVPLFRPNW